MSGGRAPKVKGSAFEIATCRALSVWVSDGKNDELFWRAAMSGGRATVKHARTGVAQYVSGDICSTHPDGHALTDHYFVECKHVVNLQLMSFMLRGTGLLASYWAKCSLQAKHHQRHPMLVAKQNMFEPVICLPTGQGLFDGACCVIPKAHCAVYPLSSILSRKFLVMP